MTKKETVIETAKFSKEALLKAAIFTDRQDALGVVVQDGEELAIGEVQARLEAFMQGEVK